MSDRTLDVRSLGLRRLALVPMIAAAAACSEGGESPTGPTPETPPPAPTVFKVNVQALKITISDTEACDGRNIFTQNPEPGEFHWRVDAGIGNNVASISSRGYGSVTGTPYPRSPKGEINFADTDWEFRDLGASDQIVVTLRGIEWDGLGRDRSLNDIAGTFTIDADRITENRTTIDIGSSTCGMTLTFTYQVAAQ